MDVTLGLVLGIGVALLVVAGLMGAGLAIGFAKLSPLPAKPPEAKPPAEPAYPKVLAARKAAYRQGSMFWSAWRCSRRYSLQLPFSLRGPWYSCSSSPWSKRA